MEEMKEVLKKIWDEFIYGAHLAAVGPVIMVLIASKLQGFDYSWFSLISVYLITYVAYNLDRYLDLKTNNDYRSKHLAKTAKFLPFLIAGATISVLAISAFSNFASFALSVFLLLVAYSYNLVFKKITKSIIGFKSLFVSSTYALTVMAANTYHGLPLSLAVWALFFFFALRVLSNTIFCDIKDIGADSQQGLKTLPVTMARNRLNLLLVALNILSAVPIIIGVAFGAFSNISLLLLLVIPYFFIYFSLSRQRQADFQKLSNVWADGELIIWLMIFLGGVAWS